MVATTASAQMVDFSNVKDGGNFNKSRVPSGDYLAKIIKVEDAKPKGDDTSHMYLFTIQLQKFSQNKYPYYCKLTENQLWKLRNLLIAAGMTVPKKRMKLDPSKVVGKTIGVTMEDAEYEGKLQSEVAAVFPAAELMDGSVADDDDENDDVDEVEEDEEETEEVEEVEEEEDEEEEAGDELDGLERLELRKVLKGLRPDFNTSKSHSDDDIRNLIREARGAADEDEEEEEEEAPAPVAKKKPAAKKKASADISDDELEEVDIDDL